MYIAMVDDDETMEPPVVLAIGSGDEEDERIRQGWRDFDARDARCFDEEDNKRN